jgi:hypothetical protein
MVPCPHAGGGTGAAGIQKNMRCPPQILFKHFLSSCIHSNDSLIQTGQLQLVPKIQTNPQSITLTFGRVAKTSPRPGDGAYFAEQVPFFKRRHHALLKS